MTTFEELLKVYLEIKKENPNRYVSPLEIILQAVDKQITEAKNVNIKLSKDFLINLKEIGNIDIKWDNEKIKDISERKKGWKSIPGLEPIIKEEYFNPAYYANWIEKYIYRNRRDLILLNISICGDSVCIQSPELEKLKRKNIYG
jgi:Rad3-related DNA helicase